MVLRDRDANTAWTAASDGTLEERVYYLQNWRADVALIDGSTDGNVLEMVRYDPYGESFCISPADNTHGKTSGVKGFGVPDGDSEPAARVPRSPSGTDALEVCRRCAGGVPQMLTITGFPRLVSASLALLALALERRTMLPRWT